MFPIFNPMIDKTKVVTPMTAIANHILTDSTAKETPTARASMLVATAIRNIVRTEKSGSGTTFSHAAASRIMFKPISPNKTNAIQ